jgi:hypothetical protein
LDVQTCFAGAPLLLNITKEIFFRMIKAPYISICNFFQNFMIGIRLQIILKSTKLKTPSGTLTQGVTRATTQQPAFLHPQRL